MHAERAQEDAEQTRHPAVPPTDNVADLVAFLEALTSPGPSDLPLTDTPASVPSGLPLAD